jgi:hypothetical protein
MTDEQQQATDEQQEREWTSEDRAKRAIVLQVLRDDHPERWTRAELEHELPDVLPEAVEVAIEDLKVGGSPVVRRRAGLGVSVRADA